MCVYGCLHIKCSSKTMAACTDSPKCCFVINYAPVTRGNMMEPDLGNCRQSAKRCGTMTSPLGHRQWKHLNQTFCMLFHELLSRRSPRLMLTFLRLASVCIWCCTLICVFYLPEVPIQMCSNYDVANQTAAMHFFVAYGYFLNFSIVFHKIYIVS